jgi:hypothetical protein
MNYRDELNKAVLQIIEEIESMGLGGVALNLIDEQTIILLTKDALAKTIKKVTKQTVYVDYDSNNGIQAFFTNGSLFDISKLSRKNIKLLLSIFKKDLYVQIYNIQAESLKERYLNKLVKGKIVKLGDNQHEVVLHNKKIECILPRRYCVKTDDYAVDKEMLFYVSNIVTKNKPYLILNRTFKKFTELILKAHLKPSDMIQIKCVKRKPGEYSAVTSNIYIPKHILESTRKLIGGEKLYVFKK